MRARHAAPAWADMLLGRRVPALLIPLGVALALGLPPPQAARTFVDSATYLDLGADKPPLPFLFFALVGTGYAAVCVQALLSITAWAWCGWMLLGGVGAALGSALALAAPVWLWNGAILSESLALSGCALSIGATLALADAWTPARFIGWTAAILAFTAARVGDFLLVPFLAAPLLLLTPRTARKLAVAAVLLVALGAGLAWTASGGERERAQMRMTSIVLDRVLVDPALQAYFVARGMPVEPALDEFRGHADWAMPLLRGAEFRRATPLLQAWLAADATTTYAGWLVAAAPHGVVADALARRSADGVVHPLRHYGQGIVHPAAAGVLAAPFAAAAPPLWLWLALLGLTIGYAAATRQLSSAAALALSLAIGTYALAFAGYHGDALEVDRHLFPARVLYRIVPWIAVAALVRPTAFRAP